ncbi:MAG: outer membrane lipoprotein carrier protein LolA [Cellvibrionaceae bacterium]
MSFPRALLADEIPHREAKTRELIAQLEQRIELAETIKGTFNQRKTISVLPEPLHSHGTFGYDRRTGLEWETLAPIANRLVFDDQGIRQSVDGQAVWEIDVSQPAVVTVTRVISSVLAADWSTLQDYFSLSGSIDEQGWQLRLEPDDVVLAEIVSAIAVSGNRVLSRMTLLEANGDRTEITFSVHGSTEQP